MSERIKVTVGCSCHNCPEAHGIEVLRSESAIEQAARKVAEVRAKLHRGECVGEELTEALDALCEAVLIPQQP